MEQNCWEMRGCGGVTGDCPHFNFGVCPRSCMYTVCHRSTYEKASGMEMLDAYDVDFGAALKENCHTCRYFLKNAPRVQSSEG